MKESIQTKSFDFEIKSTKDDGTFSGYGSVFGNVDSYGEIVAPGAFKSSLKATRDKGRNVPILWQHRTDEPIGVWDSLSEDDHGLKGSGSLWLEDASYARIANRGMKSNAITGLSIGYYVKKSSMDDDTGIRTLMELDLIEISIVTNPANQEARIDAVKAALLEGKMPSLKEFEDFLRESGFSKAQATVIASHGLRKLFRSESGRSSGDILKALEAFSLQ